MKKNLLCLLVMGLFITNNVSAASNPYRQVGPYGTNCTWYAWKIAYEKAGLLLPGWGNAKNWYNDAKRDGYSVGTHPKSNSIIVWGDWTSYGHVGYVEKVEDNVLHIWDSTGPCIDEEDPEYIECIANGVSEETDKICRANAKRKACEYTISPSQYTITGYIYLDEAPKETNSSRNENTISKKENSSTTNEEDVKSNNTNLSNIELNHGTIEFNKDILEYNVVVENEIDTITIAAVLEDKKASVNGTGVYKLSEGSNEIKIIVTAEDGSNKEYKIFVNRKPKIEENIGLDVIENNENSKNNQKSVIVIGVSIVLTILLITILIYMFKTKARTK